MISRTLSPISATLRIVCLSAHTMESMSSLNWSGGTWRKAVGGGGGSTVTTPPVLIPYNFRGANIRGFRGWRPDHKYFTHEWSDLAYLYLQCKLQPRKYYQRNVSILLNHEYFVPRKLPAIQYLYTLYQIVTSFCAHHSIVVQHLTLMQRNFFTSKIIKLCENNHYKRLLMYIAHIEARFFFHTIGDQQRFLTLTHNAIGHWSSYWRMLAICKLSVTSWPC